MLFLLILVQVGLSRCFIGGGEQGLFRELNPGLLAPETRIRCYTWPGSKWRPSVCEADTIATRLQVLLRLNAMRFHAAVLDVFDGMWPRA